MNNEIVAVSRDQYDDQVDLFALVSRLWRQRWLIAACTALSLACAIFYLQHATYSYTAELKVTPAQSSGSGTSRLGRLAGLASVAGFDMPQDPGAMSFTLYTEGLKARSVAEVLARRSDLMRVIFQGEWDPQKRRFVEPENSVTRMIGSVKKLLGIPVYPWQAPDAARLHAFIEANVEVQEDATSPVTTISFSHMDPDFAESFLMALHDTTDGEVRRKARTRSSQYIDYLSLQLRSVSIAEHRVALAQALSEQEKTRMMASSTLSFAAEPFGPATASLRPTSPKPVAVLAVGLAVGVTFGILAALLQTQLAIHGVHLRSPAARG